MDKELSVILEAACCDLQHILQKKMFHCEESCGINDIDLQHCQGCGFSQVSLLETRNICMKMCSKTASVSGFTLEILETISGGQMFEGGGGCSLFLQGIQ